MKEANKEAGAHPKQRIERIDLLQLAKLWHASTGGPDALYAGEIVDKMKQCGMVKSQHPEIIEWAKEQDKKDGRPR